MSHSRRERMIRIGSWLILVMALLPAITFMGHWPAVGADMHADTHDAASVAEHEAHCHGGVSNCAGAEAMVGSAWVGEEPDTLSLNSPNVMVDRDQHALAVEGELSVILQPPRAV